MAGFLSASRAGTIAVAGTSLSRLAVDGLRVVQTMPGTRERTVTQAGAGSAVIHQIVQTGGWLSSGRIAQGWLAALVLNHARSGAFSAQGCSLNPGSVLLHGSESTHFSYSKGAAELSWVFLPLDLLRSCWPLPGGGGLPICGRSSWLMLVEPARLVRLCRVINNLNGAPNYSGSSPLLSDGDGPGNQLLEAFMEVATSCPLRPIQLTRQADITAAAMDYIDQRGGQTIYVKDLCSSCGVRERALQHAFKTLLQVSPMRYLKLRRLHAARESLLKAGDQCSVKRCALEAGFRELGRFAADYSHVFGESPSATLKGPRARADAVAASEAKRILHSGYR